MPPAGAPRQGGVADKRAAERRALSAAATPTREENTMTTIFLILRSAKCRLAPISPTSRDATMRHFS